MATITREYKESTLYPLSDVEIGDFFEYNKKLFMRLPSRPAKPIKHRMIPCWNFFKSRLFNLNLRTIVYKCPNIEIKYNLELKYEKEFPEEPE